VAQVELEVMQQATDRLVNAASSVPFLTVLGVNFMTFNEALEAATLMLGFVTGVIALLFQIRRYLRGRKRASQS
jgi:hypothetical protein